MEKMAFVPDKHEAGLLNWLIKSVIWWFVCLLVATAILNRAVRLGDNIESFDKWLFSQQDMEVAAWTSVIKNNFNYSL